MKAVIIPILLALAGLQSYQPEPQTDWVEKIKSNLEQVYTAKELSLGPVTVKEKGDQIEVSGKASLQKQAVHLSAEFTKSADLLQIIATFPESKKMNKRSFKRFSKGPSLAEWFPKDILKSIKVSELQFEFAPQNNQKESRLQSMQLQIKSTSSWKFADQDQFQLRDIKGALLIEDPNGKKRQSAQLSGNLKVGKSTFAVDAQRNNNGADWILKGQLAKINLGEVLDGLSSGPLNLNADLPISMNGVEINQAEFAAYPNRKAFSLSGLSTIGKTEIWITPKNKSK
ncbi:MAG: hypothetical protein AAF705_13765, partial [Bacteroidota bacterium]